MANVTPNSIDGNAKPPDQSHLPATIPIDHPWLSRLSQSAILYHDNGPSGSNEIHTVDKEIYGNPSYPILFRIGNGGAGYTGLLQLLAEHYLSSRRHQFRIGWVSNHSRHTQAALLADIVQVALTYEPQNEDLAIEEGWCRRVCRAFNDHFILAGPASDPAGLRRRGDGVVDALRAIAMHADGGSASTVFHTRGDGSATYFREQKLWARAQVSTAGAPSWLCTHAVPPYQALVKAEEASAYLLTDRATYLTAKRDGVIPNLRVYVEGGAELLNPCAAVVNVKAANDPAHMAAWEFAEWLASDEAEGLVRGYGKDWSCGKALFTVATQDEFEASESLINLDI